MLMMNKIKLILSIYYSLVHLALASFHDTNRTVIQFFSDLVKTLQIRFTVVPSIKYVFCYENCKLYFLSFCVSTTGRVNKWVVELAK